MSGPFNIADITMAVPLLGAVSPFGRLKNWRIATRYDRHAQNYLAAIALVAVVSEWTK